MAVTPKLLLDSETSVAEAIVGCLEGAGIGAVFGMPGGYTFSIFDALRDHASSVRTVLVREEAKAGVMAEVYGRLTGRPGVCMGQCAFLVHASMGAIEATLSSSPMLLLTDLSDNYPLSQHGPYQSATGEYGSWDARQVYGGMTKDLYVAHDPVQAVHAVQLGIKAAMTGEPGPVAVLLWSGALRGRVGPQSRPALYDMESYLAPLRPRGADADSVRDAAAVLRGATSPVIVAGGGVRLSGAYAELAALADRLGAPVATTASGKGCYPETGDWALGVMGNFGTPLANAVVGGADVVLAVGTKLGPTDTAAENPDLLDPARQQIVQIEVEPRNASWTYPNAVTLLGDARLTLASLATALADVATSARADRRAALAEARLVHGHFDAPELQADKVPILPQRVIGALQEALPAEAIVACDAGENRIFMTHYFQSKGPATFIQPAGVGGMGYAIPAALAAKLVHPDRPVVALCGDGGFAIGMNGMMTAREEDLPIVTVVLNNQALGWVRHSQGDRPIASEFAAFDHAAIANAMGITGVRVTEAVDLGPVLRRAIDSGEPTVVDVRTSLEETFARVTSPLMRRR